jgi:hypothetical protein
VEPLVDGGEDLQALFDQGERRSYGRVGRLLSGEDVLGGRDLLGRFDQHAKQLEQHGGRLLGRERDDVVP